MRRQQDIVMVLGMAYQRMLGGLEIQTELALQNIRAIAGDMARFQRSQQRCLVHQFCPCRIDEQAARFEMAQYLGADQILGFRQGRNMQADHVGPCHQFFQPFGAFGDAVGFGKWVMVTHSHIKGRAIARHPTAQAAMADNTQL